MSTEFREEEIRCDDYEYPGYYTIRTCDACMGPCQGSSTTTCDACGSWHGDTVLTWPDGSQARHCDDCVEQGRKDGGR